MFAANASNDLNHCSDNIPGLGGFAREGPRATSTGSSLVAQPDPWPHRTSTYRQHRLASSGFVPVGQPPENIDFETRGDASGHATFTSSTDAILHQAIPETLATPKGWHSEFLQASSAEFDNAQASNAAQWYNNDTISQEQHENFSSLNVDDGPPTLLSSYNETNEYSSGNTGTSLNISSSEQPLPEKTVKLTAEQRAAIANIDSQQPPPLVIRKHSTEAPMNYVQNVSIRYLQPPTPPLPGPIIIREIRPPPRCPLSPIRIRQRPRPACTPPPIVIRERPPPVPPRLPSQVIERLLPPPPRPPRRLIVEQFGACPPKPPDVVVERWLPYRRNEERRIFFERVPVPYRPPSPNVVVMHGQANARIQKEFVNQGVTRADPQYYLQLYGNEINSTNLQSQFAHLINEATHTYPPPPPPQAMPPTLDYRTAHPSYPNADHHPPSPLISSVWERMKSAPPAPPAWSPPSPHHPAPYPPQYPSYGYPGPYPAANQWSPHQGYPPQFNDPRSMPCAASAWPGQSYPAPPLPPPSPPLTGMSGPVQTLNVRSDQELHHVLSGLTNGRVPTPLRAA